MHKESIEQLHSFLSNRFPDHLLATSDKEVVVEGFPRSANTFLVEFMLLSAAAKDIPLKIAHHTHDPRNIILGIKNELPCVVLLRDPVDAIASYCIYQNLSVETSAKKYMDFYSPLLNFSGEFLLITFSQILQDPNAVIEAVNSRFCIRIPMADNRDRISQLALQSIKKRSLKTHGKANFTRKSGAPTEDRKALIEDLRPKVVCYLNTHPSAADLHALFQKACTS